MSRTVVLSDKAINNLMEVVKAGGNTASLDPVEADEYTIGSEAGPVPVGGTNFHITEEILKEGLSQNLYHFTGLDAAFKICSDDVIYLQSAYSKDSDNYDKKRKFYLSCARQPNVKMGFASKYSNGGVRICLDGDKLSQRFAGNAVNYWAGDTFMNKHRYYQYLAKDENELWDKNSWEIKRLKEKNPNITDDEIKQYLVKNYNPEVQKHLDNEIEDRLLSYEPAIYDAHKYIKSIDVFIPGVFEDEEKMSEAAAFLYNTFLGRSGYVKLFDSLEQFSHPHGQPVNDKIPYKWDQMYNHKNAKQSLDCLIGVVGFITYGDDVYAGENFGPAVAKLLKKYGLEKYTKDIGRIKNAFRWCSVQSVAEKADSIRRELSDEPSEDKSKMLKMLTDYCLSIGADNFRQAYVIKKKQEDNKYNKVYDRVDTSVKLPYVIVGNYVISLNPDKDKFIDAVGWNEEDCKNYAEMLAYEAYENHDGKYNNKGSKNYNSMFFYLYKMLRSGTVKQVMDGFNKIGFDYEYLNDWRMGISVQDMDYWDAVRMETVQSMKAKRSGTDYKSVNSIRDKGVEQYIASKTMKESVRSTKGLITEGAESRNMSAAKHYLYNNFGYDEAKAMQLIGSIKTDIPNVRLAKCKFILGVTRMFMTGELKDARTIMSVNKTLKLVASDTHVNEYDQNLNNFTAEQLVEKFATASQADLEGDMNDVYSQQYEGNTDYNIVRIDSFDQACQYGDYTTWCVTHNNGMFESYTAEGLNVFYFCLKQGFEEVPQYKEEGCPLDEYGLSMIAVSVCPDGSLNTCTCRWNHDNGGNDQIMNTKEISSVIGMNFYEVFKPISEEEYTQRIITAIEDGGRELGNIVKGDFVIPEGTRRIGPEAFAYCGDLKSIVIPNSVTSIGVEAFCECSGLTSIIIPESVEEIGGYAFFECSNLQSAQINSQQASIGYYAFDSCVRLTSINLPMNLEKIDIGVFRGCMSLTSIVIPNRVSSICRYAFLKCENLQSIKLPFGLKRIGGNAFGGCHSLQSINLPVGLKEIENQAFEGCSSLNEVNIPWTVTEIGHRAFYFCTNLQRAVISKNVNHIGYCAFDECNQGLTIYTDHPYINEFFDEGSYRILPMSACTETIGESAKIGSEKGPTPVGGSYFHTQKKIGEIKEDVITEQTEDITSVDLSTVGVIEYDTDFDEDSYREWLDEEEIEDNVSTMWQYYREYVTFNLELFDNEIMHHMAYSYAWYNDLVEAFGEKMAEQMVKNCIENGGGRFETYELYEDEKVDVNDPSSVASYAKKIFQHGEYRKDARGFILPDGEMIYTDLEHNAVASIPGIDNKFQFIRLGNIRVLSKSIDIGQEPTPEQYEVLRQIAATYSDSELYLDIFTKSGEFGCVYVKASPNYVLGEIRRYYSDGIRPQGNKVYEEKINEDVSSSPDDERINQLSNEIATFMSAMNEKYGRKFWFSKALNPELEVDPADLEKRNALYDEYNRLKKIKDDERNKEEERKRLEKAQENARRIQEENQIIELAVDNYGTAYSLRDAGYILPDGRLLDFHRNGDAEDHRNIAYVYQSNDIKIWDTTYRYNYVVDFMNHGAIRCDVNRGLLDMTKEPSDEQYSVIKKFVRIAGDVDIDFTNNVGNTDYSVSYSNVSPQRVVADIQRYYQEGIRPQGNVQYEGVDKKKVIKENVEDEVDASEVDLSSFEKKDSLEPSIWKDGKLDSRIRLKLLDIADDFWDFLGIDWSEPVGIHLTGSICGFNYSKFSDIDLHIVADFSEIDERTNFVRQYMDEKKAAWNNAHPGLKIMGYEVELYVEDVSDDTKSEGVYDLEENEWISKPKSPVEISSGDSIKNKAAEIMTIIDGMGDMLDNADDSHVFDEIYDDAILMFGKLKRMRMSALDSEGESGVGNIVYKSLRRVGYLDKLSDILNRAYDKSNSINESSIIKEDWSDGEKDPIQYLYQYLKWASNASDWEKVKDLVYHCPWKCRRYFMDNCEKYENSDEYGIDIDELEYSDEETIQKFINWVDDNVGLKEFIEDAHYYWYAEDLPSWMTMELEKYMPNSWLIHFTNDADSVAREGFKYGTYDTDELAYTKRASKGEAGYDFAFDINDTLNSNYGDEAVIFRTSGVKVYHWGDNESQVIFWGPSVKWMIPIRLEEDYEDWVLRSGYDDRVLCVGRPSEIAQWVDQNYPQYKKAIVWNVKEMHNRIKRLVENRILFEGPVGDFDAWYGNSVLRDEEGNPIKMYHGTDNKFDKFDKAFIGSSGSGSYEGYGFNFTPFQTTAGNYSSPSGEVWEAYLKAEHPLANDKKTITPRKLMEIIRKLDEGLPVTDRMVWAYETRRYNEKWDERAYNRVLPIVAKQLYDYTESDADLYAEICAGGASDKYRVIDTFEELGYDSCILKDNNGRLKTVVVFEPEQIMRCSEFENNALHESIEEDLIQDEVVADGNSSHNPYSKRWKAEREALKSFLVNFGKTMTSKENGKQYKVYFDHSMSDLIGYNYCICVQWDPIEMIPSSVPYIRALDKFTERIFQPHFDTRGFDNIQGTADDVVVPVS